MVRYENLLPSFHHLLLHSPLPSIWHDPLLLRKTNTATQKPPLLLTVHLRTTVQGVVSGLHWGLGVGIGSMLGGVLYAGLGARLCFAISAVLPLLSLLLLSLPMAREWYTNAQKLWWGKKRVQEQDNQGDGGSYELVVKVIK